MHTKTLKILGIVFVIVAALTWLLIDLSKDTGTNEELTTAIQFTEFTSTITHEITIASPERSLHFKKENDKWFLDGREVLQEKIDEFFTTLHEIKVQSLASKNKDNHTKFEVDEEKGTKITFRQGESEQKFIIGKRGVDRETFYARNVDKANVYLMKGDLLTYFMQESSDWTGGVEVVAYDPGAVQKVTVQDGPNLYTYGIDTEGNWAIIKNGQFAPLAENRQRNIELMTTHFSAEAELGETEKQEFSTISRKVVVSFFDQSGKSLENLRVTKNGTAWWIERGEHLYSVEQDIFSNILGW